MMRLITTPLEHRFPWYVQLFFWNQKRRGGGTSNYLISPCGGQANEPTDISDGRAELSAVYARH